MRRKRRIFLACLMSLMMALVMAMPMSASAADTTVNDNLQTAIDNANSGDTIKLGADFMEDITIPADKTIILDLNGFKLNGKSGDTISNKGNLTIKDSGDKGTGAVLNSISGKGSLVNYPGGKAVLSGGKFTADKWYTIKNMGDMIINEGVTVTTETTGSSLIDNGWYGNAGNDRNTDYGVSLANLTITGGTFSGGMNTVKNDDYGVLEINDGEFTNTSGPVIMNWNVAKINNGVFVVPEGFVLANGYLDDTADKGQLTIVDGIFVSGKNGSDKFLGTCVGTKNGGFVEIQGGIIASDVIDGDYAYDVTVKAGVYSQIPASEVINNDKILIEFKLAKDEAVIYCIGTEEELNEVIKGASKGDEIVVLKGSIELNIDVGGVKITNDINNKGKVFAKGTELKPNYGITTLENSGSTNPPTTGKDTTTTTPPAEKPDKSAETGDEMNLAIPTVLATLALIGVTGVFAARRRHN